MGIKVEAEKSSFRDPSGFIFHRDGVLYRQINLSYKENYDLLISSGLYRKLTDGNLLIPHEEVDSKVAQEDGAYKVIRPREVPFISYPYEWCFSETKDAALATLNVQKTALEFGMSLKDASAYNIQFVDGKPLSIDTLSFEKYEEGKPWVAYRQFCQHFLAPLALMSFVDARLGQLLRIYIDGVPLDLASRLLPSKTRLNFSLLAHIHLHAVSQKHFADKKAAVSRDVGVSKKALLGLIDNLEGAVSSLKWKQGESEWGSYYSSTNYSSEAFSHKKKIVEEFLKEAYPKTVWDLGANTGEFSRIASDLGAMTVSWDLDPLAVEKNYLQVKGDRGGNLLPLFLDLTNPSPSLGWANEERKSLIERGPADLAMALALIHHLAIGNNLPFSKIAEFFGRICYFLIIEFVPKEDSNVQKMLLTREDIFKNYDGKSFEEAFSESFSIVEKQKVRDSGRILYLMKKAERHPSGS